MNLVNYRDTTAKTLFAPQTQAPSGLPDPAGESLPQPKRLRRPQPAECPTCHARGNWDEEIQLYRCSRSSSHDPFREHPAITASQQEQLALLEPRASQAAQKALLAAGACGTTWKLGECGSGHQFAINLHCGRDFCAACGGRNGEAHLRRYARILPKVLQMEEMGYFVIQFRKEDRERFRTKKELSKAGIRITKILKRWGFTRGLRRWDWFGDARCPVCSKPGHWDDDHGWYTCKAHGHYKPEDVLHMPWHPHLNVLVEAGWREIRQITAIQREISEALKLGFVAEIDETGAIKKGTLKKGVILHYDYVKRQKNTGIAQDPDAQGHMLHNARYIEKPTFLSPDWDMGMLGELAGFRNGSWWGKWRGDPKWGLKERPESGEMAPILALSSGECPLCGATVRWGNLIRFRGAAEAGWIPLGAGYYQVVATPNSDPPDRAEELYWLSGGQES